MFVRVFLIFAAVVTSAQGHALFGQSIQYGTPIYSDSAIPSDGSIILYGDSGIPSGSTIIRSGDSGIPPGSTIIRSGDSAIPFRDSQIPGGDITIRRESPSGAPLQEAASRAEKRLPFDQFFWRYLSDSRYRLWAPPPGTNGDAYYGREPHGSLLKMYLNRKAVGRPDELPDGSILVMESFEADGETLRAVDVMYRSDGYNAGAGDWYWASYSPDGKAERMETDTGSEKLAGRVRTCIECHSRAQGGDLAFFNDRNDAGAESPALSER
ncbi:MAG: cytochrome P460 family protein [Planctomycetaceae bacterium]